MQVAGIRRLDARIEMIEAGEPLPLAGDEVPLEVRAAGVGNWDEFVRTGGWEGTKPPMAMGVEAAGTVLAVGHAVDDWAPGDAVITHPIPLRDQGTWAPQLIAPAGLLARKPPSASWEVAAAFALPALTAEQVLGDALNIRAGEQLLVHQRSHRRPAGRPRLVARRPGHRDGRPRKPAAGKCAGGAPGHRLPRSGMARTGPRDNGTPRSGRRGQRGTRRRRQRDPGGRRWGAAGDHHPRPARPSAS